MPVESGVIGSLVIQTDTINTRSIGMRHERSLNLEEKKRKEKSALLSVVQEKLMI